MTLKLQAIVSCAAVCSSTSVAKKVFRAAQAATPDAGTTSTEVTVTTGSAQKKDAAPQDENPKSADASFTSLEMGPDVLLKTAEQVRCFYTCTKKILYTHTREENNFKFMFTKN